MSEMPIHQCVQDDHMCNGNCENCQHSAEGSIVESCESKKHLLIEATERAEEYMNKLKYLQADFDNYRKQFDKEKEAITLLANEWLIKDLLGIVDDLERAVKIAEPGKTKDGLGLLSKNFMKILEKYGVKRMNAVGNPFDPFVHEVVAKETSSDEDGTVTEELQTGYTLYGKVIRPAQVKITEHTTEEGESQ